MELLQKLPVQKSKNSPRQAVENHPSMAEGDMVIHLSSSNYHESAMSEARKQEVRKHAPSLPSLFDQVVKQKESYNPTSENWLSDQEVKLEGVSKMDIHTFILEAEKLGKKITYTQTLTVQVTD